MKKLNQKGITILEIIIAIAILTTILFSGYRILNKYSVSAQNQVNTNKRQLAMNIMNKYLTKDLEQSNRVRLLLNGQEIANTNDTDNSNSILKEKINDIKDEISKNNNAYYDYEISVNKNNKENQIIAKYSIVINKNNNRMEYTISREDKNKTKIDLIDNEILNKDELPLAIIGNNPYTVITGYNEKNNNFNKYEFTITSRVNYIASLEEPDGDSDLGDIPENMPEDIPEDIPVNPPFPDDIDKLTTTHIGFWISDKSKSESQNGTYENSIYTWVGNNGKFGNQDNLSKEVFDISANNNKSGNSGKTKSSISHDRSNIIVENTINKANNINAIKIFVSPHTSVSDLNLKFDKGTYSGIKDVETGTTLSNSSGSKFTLQGGESGKWYEVIYKPSNNQQFSYEMLAKLHIDKSKVSSGYAMLIYGTKINTYNNGDIVYEWETKNDNNQIKYGVQAYATVGSDQNRRIEEQYNQERNMSIQIDKGSTPPIIRARGLNSEIATSDQIFKDIKSIQLKVEGQLTLTNVRFNNKTMSDLNYTNNSMIIDLNQSSMSNGLEANFNFSNMKEDKNSGKLIINFIYNN